MLQYEYDVGQVMATCLLVISHILPRRASEGESFLPACALCMMK